MAGRPKKSKKELRKPHDIYATDTRWNEIKQGAEKEKVTISAFLTQSTGDRPISMAKGLELITLLQKIRRQQADIFDLIEQNDEHATVSVLSRLLKIEEACEAAVNVLVKRCS